MKNDKHIHSMNHPLISTFALCLPLIAILGSLSSAQQIGKQAEMDRLELQGENLAAQADPEGAALAFGKAAMMAELLRTDAQEPATQKILHATSYLFRAQEQSLRALALFELAGGIPPASAGVCQYLDQGNRKLHHSKNLLEDTTAFPQMEITMRRTLLLDKSQEWENLLQGLHEDFGCPDLSIER